jgi:hypothetical protein
MDALRLIVRNPGDIDIVDPILKLERNDNEDEHAAYPKRLKLLPKLERPLNDMLLPRAHILMTDKANVEPTPTQPVTDNVDPERIKDLKLN